MKVHSLDTVPFGDGFFLINGLSLSLSFFFFFSGSSCILFLTILHSSIQNSHLTLSTFPFKCSLFFSYPSLFSLISFQSLSLSHSVMGNSRSSSTSLHHTKEHLEPQILHSYQVSEIYSMHMESTEYRVLITLHIQQPFYQ